MHYLPNLLNRNNFFLHLASLNPNPNTSASLTKKIERFLYRGTSTLQSIIAMEHSIKESEKLGLEYVQQIEFDEKNRISFACSELFLAFAQIPATLSSLVVMQNQLLRLISAITGEGQNIPKSMNDAFKKGIENFGFNDEIIELLNDYWNNGGKYIRELRNVNEHFDALVDYTFFQFQDQKGKVLIFLPDNPEIKSPSKFTYDLENNAIEILFNEIKSINDLLSSICKMKDIEKGQFRPSIVITQKKDLNNNIRKTLGIFINVEEVNNDKKGLYTMELRQNGINEKKQPLLEFNTLKTDKEI